MSSEALLGAKGDWGLTLPRRYRWILVCWLWLSTAGMVAALPNNLMAQTVVDLELVLAVDVSWSVSEDEFALQMGAIAAAFREPELHDMIGKAGNRGIAIALLQWAGYREQRVAVDWMVVRDSATARRFAERVDAVERLIIGATDIAGALSYGAQMLISNDYHADRMVIDVSGDGPSNEGKSPRQLRPTLAAAGITVNGLPLLTESADLDQYYADQVVAGPGAFLIPALGYQDFDRALRAKLLREIRGQAVVRR